MADLYGKKFEKKLASDWSKVSNSFIYRLKDIMSGYKAIKNISDFVAYIFPYQFFLEAKTEKSGTLNFSRIRQYDDLKSTMGHYGVNAGVIIWFYNKQKVCYVPIEECVRLKEVLHKKSINVKMIGNNEYQVYEIPSVVKRVFMDSDYSVMKSIADEKFNMKNMVG